MKARLLKMMALADDPRTPKGEADSARAMAENFAKIHGIDLNKLKQEAPAELQMRYGKRRLRFAGRLAATLVGKFYEVRIDFDQYFLSASSKLVFRGAPMETLKAAHKLFQEVESSILIAYENAKMEWKFMRFSSKFGGQERLCKRSYMTGYHNGLRQSLEAGEKSDERRRQRLALPKPVEPPRPPEPPNPFALAIIEKAKPLASEAVQTVSIQQESVADADTAEAKPPQKPTKKLDHDSYGAGLNDGKRRILKHAKRR